MSTCTESISGISQLNGHFTEMDCQLQNATIVLKSLQNYITTLPPNLKMALHHSSNHQSQWNVIYEMTRNINNYFAIYQNDLDNTDMCNKCSVGLSNYPIAQQFLPLQATGQDNFLSNKSAMLSAPINELHKKNASIQPSVWSGFYNKTLRERLDVLHLMYPQLKSASSLEPNKATIKMDAVSDGAIGSCTPSNLKGSSGNSSLSQIGTLPLLTANLMIENCIGVLGIPLGLGLNFIIDGQSYAVPMSVEEPSVVAAASGAAKLIAKGGGFRTYTTENVMTSQIQLVGTPDIQYAIQAIEQNRERLLQLANTSFCANMKKRGGGAIDIYCRIVTSKSPCRNYSDNGAPYWYTPCKNEIKIDVSNETGTTNTKNRGNVEYLVVHIDVDVCEAMGANIVNTVAEGLSGEVCRLTKSQRCGLRILTNLCMQRRARAVFEMPVSMLGWKGVSGEDVANRIIEAYNFAAMDPYRAVTNNKGIMNGIDAAAVATGQDWRAIEAAAHCYASRSGQYRSLSKYEIISDSQTSFKILRGSLEIPIAVGSKGGALGTHPGYSITHKILKNPNARTLSSILLSVGLSQNFAAVRAIAVTGIQEGHMALHARNIAVAAGAPSALVSELCTYMKGRRSINVETAKEYLNAHSLYTNRISPPISPKQEDPRLPSMLYVAIPVPSGEIVSINIAFESLNRIRKYIVIADPKSVSMNASKDQESSMKIQKHLLGDKGYNQLEKMFYFLASMRSIMAADNLSRGNTENSDDMDESTPIRANTDLQDKLQLLSILLNIVTTRLMEMHSNIVAIYMKNFLKHHEIVNGEHQAIIDIKCAELLPNNVLVDDEALCTGLPLHLALWQVLRYHVEQDVESIPLQTHILQEQWRLIYYIAESFSLPTNTEARCDSNKQLEGKLSEYMKIQAKRWQATMLLLIDTMAISSDILSKGNFLDYVEQIGDYMEWEATLAHDLARVNRALQDKSPNAFVYWLHLIGELPLELKSDVNIEALVTSEHIEQFAILVHTLTDRKLKALREQKSNAMSSPQANFPFQMFSLSAVSTVLDKIRVVYGERDKRSRNESF